MTIKLFGHLPANPTSFSRRCSTRPTIASNESSPTVKSRVVKLKGAAKIRFEDQIIEMQPGDFLNIPAHTKHRVEWTTLDEPTIWLAVFYKNER